MNPETVVKDKKYGKQGMYRLKWPDRVLSEDFYNLTRANDILKNYEEYQDNMNRRGNTYRKDALSEKNKPRGCV